jgi:hypothetical protein
MDGVCLLVQREGCNRRQEAGRNVIVRFHGDDPTVPAGRRRFREPGGI